MTPSVSQVYWWNKETRETSWAHPVTGETAGEAGEGEGEGEGEGAAEAAADSPTAVQEIDMDSGAILDSIRCVQRSAEPPVPASVPCSGTDRVVGVRVCFAAALWCSKPRCGRRTPRGAFAESTSTRATPSPWSSKTPRHGCTSAERRSSFRRTGFDFRHAASESESGLWQLRASSSPERKAGI